ncbi:MAG: ABC transporter permease [Angelakisella sp.]
MNGLELYLQTAAQMGTPILFATLGGILCEKVGHLNLGVEGMMLLGAVMGFKIGYLTGNPVLAVLAAGLAGMFGGLIYAVVTVTFQGNHTVTGLALTTFGIGVSSFIGKSLTGLSLPATIGKAFAPVEVPLLSKIPVVGKMLFHQSPYVTAAILVGLLLWLYMNKTTLGLNMRAVGENPGAADASGVNVTLYKYTHILAGGFLCGVGGAYLSLVFVPRWQDQITAGMGWIAVALVIFATWSPIRAIFGAYFFGALKGLSFVIQNANLSIFGMKITIVGQFLDMIPYLATIVVLIFITRGRRAEHQAPKALGNPYFREER